MPDKAEENAPEPSITCAMCCNAVPLSAAFTPEGVDYVEHFCGAACYQQFLERARVHDDDGHYGPL